MRSESSCGHRPRCERSCAPRQPPLGARRWPWTFGACALPRRPSSTLPDPLGAVREWEAFWM
eukprot:6301582-Lingulodinium_polyedra.AAC.1